MWSNASQQVNDFHFRILWRWRCNCNTNIFHLKKTFSFQLTGTEICFSPSSHDSCFPNKIIDSWTWWPQTNGIHIFVELNYPHQYGDCNISIKAFRVGIPFWMCYELTDWRSHKVWLSWNRGKIIFAQVPCCFICFPWGEFSFILNAMRSGDNYFCAYETENWQWSQKSILNLNSKPSATNESTFANFVVVISGQP